jgi:hypothetical protein
MGRGREATGVGDGDKQKSAWRRAFSYPTEHVQPRFNILRPGAMGGGWRAANVGGGDTGENAQVRVSTKTDEHGRTSHNIFNDELVERAEET